eukprot:600035-Hanusia_phi.AAC.1
MRPIAPWAHRLLVLLMAARAAGGAEHGSSSSSQQGVSRGPIFPRDSPIPVDANSLLASLRERGRQLSGTRMRGGECVGSCTDDDIPSRSPEPAPPGWLSLFQAFRSAGFFKFFFGCVPGADRLVGLRYRRFMTRTFTYLTRALIALKVLPAIIPFNLVSDFLVHQIRAVESLIVHGMPTWMISILGLFIDIWKITLEAIGQYLHFRASPKSVYKPSSLILMKSSRRAQGIPSQEEYSCWHMRHVRMLNHEEDSRQEEMSGLEQDNPEIAVGRKRVDKHHADLVDSLKSILYVGKVTGEMLAGPIKELRLEIRRRGLSEELIENSCKLKEPDAVDPH